jgi:hypothetical protein
MEAGYLRQDVCFDFFQGNLVLAARCAGASPTVTMEFPLDQSSAGRKAVSISPCDLEAVAAITFLECGG